MCLSLICAFKTFNCTKKKATACISVHFSIRIAVNECFGLHTCLYLQEVSSLILEMHTVMFLLFYCLLYVF